LLICARRYCRQVRINLVTLQVTPRVAKIWIALSIGLQKCAITIRVEYEPSGSFDLQEVAGTRSNSYGCTNYETAANKQFRTVFQSFD